TGCLPQFDCFEYDSSRICDGDPDENSFDGQLVPCSNGKAHHLPRLIAPPAVGHCQRCFPKEAYEQDDEKRQAQRPPVNKRSSRWEKSCCGKHADRYEKREISRKALGVSRNEFLIDDGESDQN